MACCPRGIYRPLVIDCSGNTVPMPGDGTLRTNIIAETITVDCIASSTTNGALALVPDGTGALQAQCGGDQRGDNAVDLQISRSASTQIAASNYCVLSGGSGNGVTSVSTYSALVGGLNNSIDASTHAFIGGGELNDITVSSDLSSIIGGTTNEITSTAIENVIGGGDSNIISASKNVFLGGGQANTVTVTSNYSVICGGLFNDIDDCLYATIGGGNNQFIDDSSDWAGIFSGEGNSVLALSSYASIIGGKGNTITGGTHSFIGGGLDNTITKSYCSVPGGRDCSATAEGSVCYGDGASSFMRGQVSQAGGTFASVGDAQTFVVVARNATTDDTETSLFLDGASNSLAPPENSCWAVRATVVAQETDGTQGSMSVIEGCVRRDAAGSATAVGGGFTTVDTAQDDAAWDVYMQITGNIIRVRVTGVVATNINWVARIEVTQVVVAA